MPYDAKKHHRRSLRLSGYDYSQPGMYFVTVCTKERELMFGEVREGKMVTNAYGQVIWEEWSRSAKIRREVRLDEFVVMPNHLHGIVAIIGTGDHRVGAPGRAPGRAPLRSKI